MSLIYLEIKYILELMIRGVLSLHMKNLKEECKFVCIPNPQLHVAQLNGREK